MFDVIVIGLNEEKNLENCISSLKAIDHYINKSIFIDSGSYDQSVDKAKNYFDEVYEISGTDNKSASLARNIGTCYTSDSEWLIFLDADMTINEKFIEGIINNKLLEQDISGIVGNYNMFFNGTYDYTITRHNSIAESFGGAIVLNKKDLLEVGNWNPFVFSTEEKELYSRFKARKKLIVSYNIDMVNHYDQARQNILDKIKNLFLPKNKKNYVGLYQSLYKKEITDVIRLLTLYSETKVIYKFLTLLFLFRKKQSTFKYVPYLYVITNLKPFILATGYLTRILIAPLIVSQRSIELDIKKNLKVKKV